MTTEKRIAEIWYILSYLNSYEIWDFYSVDRKNFNEISEQIYAEKCLER